MYHVLVSFLLKYTVHENGTGKCFSSLGTFSLVTFGSRWADWQQTLPSFINQEQKVKYDSQLQSDQFSWSYVIQSSLKVILSYLYVLSQKKKVTFFHLWWYRLLLRGQSFCIISFYLIPSRDYILKLIFLYCSWKTLYSLLLQKVVCLCVRGGEIFPNKPFLAWVYYILFNSRDLNSGNV